MNPSLAVDAIPQRSPFRFIEHILHGEPGQCAEASLYLRPDNPVFAGHFPKRPIFPGVLMIEQMAQTACWVLASVPGIPQNRHYALVRVEHCEFRQHAQPGDTLVAHARLERQTGKFAFFDCQISRDGQNIARARLLVASSDSTDSGVPQS